MADHLSDTPIPPPPAEKREAVLLPYHHDGSCRSRTGICPNDLYEYIHQMARGGVGGRPVPGVTIEEQGDITDGGRFLMVLLPYPIQGFNTATGSATTVLGALLHEELSPATPGDDRQTLVVEGWLGTTHGDVSANWAEFVRSPGREVPTTDEFRRRSAEALSDMNHYMNGITEALGDRPGDAFQVPRAWIDDRQPGRFDDDIPGEDG